MSPYGLQNVSDHPGWVLAYHGTTKDAADQILVNGFTINNSDSLHLGNGVYFYEEDELAARRLAKRKSREEYGGNDNYAAVIKAKVALNKCLDLRVQSHKILLKKAYDLLSSTGRNIQYTDGSVVNFLAEKIPLHTVRALHLADDSLFKRDTVVQTMFRGSRIHRSGIDLYLCVRDENLIESPEILD